MKKDDVMFTIDFDVSVTLDRSQIWPDGDDPENPTVEDVYEAMTGERTKPDVWEMYKIVGDWDLYSMALVDVRKTKPLSSLPDPVIYKVIEKRRAELKAQAEGDDA